MSSQAAQVDRPYRFMFSAIGRKQVMAITGLLWSGFVLTHMAGNMLILVGADAYNKYSHTLITNPFIIVAQLILVVTLLGHIVNGVWLTVQNRLARKTRYAVATNGEKAARFQSKWMIFHGSLLFAFLIIHLWSFKYGHHYSTNVGGIQMRDLHRLVTEKFHDPSYVVGYLVALVFVGLHLSHGLYSSIASLGFFHPRYSPMINKIGYLYAIVVAGGFMAQPIYVYFFHR